MKKWGLIFIVLMVITGCSTPSKDGGATDSKNIKVYTRDSASGTREAFESIVGIEALTDNSAETTSNGDMATQVSKTTEGIGYVSLTTDLAANNLKALSYEGVEPTIDNVINETYTLARPFSYVTRAAGNFESNEKEQLVAAIIDFLANSTEGRQAVLAAGGIVDTTTSKSWNELKANHPIVDQDNSAIVIKTGGSTSVEKTVQKAIELFMPMAGNFKFEPNHTGSSDGFKRTLGSEKDGANAIDIGFASREFKSDETVADGLLSGVYAKDAVVVVVSKSNEAVTAVTKDTLKGIFEGTLKTWSDVK